MNGNADASPVSRRGVLRAGSAGVLAAAGLTAGSGSAAAQYGDWLSDVGNYDGTHDYRGQSEVTIEVGAGENGLRFGPAAVLIDPRTTVVWEWTGAGGAHNVVAEDGPFDSGETVGEEGHTFEYSFTDAASGDAFNYFCSPHRAVGMKGVIAIGEVDDDLVSPGDEASAGDTAAGGGDAAGGGGGAGGTGDGGGGGGGGGDGDGGNTGEPETDTTTDNALSASDIGALALGLGVAGSLLVPLFYTAHKRAERE